MSRFFSIVYWLAGGCIAGVFWLCNSSTLFTQLVSMLTSTRPGLSVDAIEGTLLNFTLHRVVYRTKYVDARIGKVVGIIRWWKILQSGRLGFSNLLLQDVAFRQKDASIPVLKNQGTQEITPEDPPPSWSAQKHKESFFSRFHFEVNFLSIKRLAVENQMTGQQLICETIETALQFQKNELSLLNPRIMKVQLSPAVSSPLQEEGTSAQFIQKVANSVQSKRWDLYFERLIATTLKNLPWERFGDPIDPLHFRPWLTQVLAVPFTIQVQSMQVFDVRCLGAKQSWDLEEASVSGICHSTALCLTQFAVRNSSFSAVGSGDIQLGLDYRAHGSLLIQDIMRQQTLRAAWSAAPTTGLNIDAQLEGAYSASAALYAPLEPSHSSSTFFQFTEESKNVLPGKDLLGVAGAEGRLWYEGEGYRWRLNGCLHTEGLSPSSLFAEGQMSPRSVDGRLYVTAEGKDKQLKDWITLALVLPRETVVDKRLEVCIKCDQLPLPRRYLPNSLKTYWRDPRISGVLQLSQPIGQKEVQLLQLRDGALHVEGQEPYCFNGSYLWKGIATPTLKLNVSMRDNRLSIAMGHQTGSLLQCHLSAISLNQLYPAWSGSIKLALCLERKAEGYQLKSCELFGRKLSWENRGSLDALHFEGGSTVAPSQCWRLELARFNYLERLYGNKIAALVSIGKDSINLDVQAWMSSLEPTYQVAVQLNKVIQEAPSTGIYTAALKGKLHLDQHVFELVNAAYISMDWINQTMSFSEQIWRAQTHRRSHTIQVDTGSLSLSKRQFCGQFLHLPLKLGNPLLRPNHLELAGYLSGSWKYLHQDGTEPLIAFECTSEELALGFYRKEEWKSILCDQLRLELTQFERQIMWSFLLDLGTSNGELSTQGVYCLEADSLEGEVHLEALNAACIAALYVPTELTVFSGALKVSKLQATWDVRGELYTQILFDEAADMPFSHPALEGTIYFKGVDHSFLFRLYQIDRHALTISGGFFFPSLRFWEGNAELRGQNLEGTLKSFGSFCGNPELQLKLTPEKALLSGTMYLDRAELFFKERDRPYRLQRPSPYSVNMEQKTSDSSTSKKNTYPIDGKVTLRLGPQVYLKAFDVDARLTGTVDCIPDQEKWQLYGSVSVADLPKGRFTGYGLNLLLEEGSILFAGPIETAMLDLKASWDEGGRYASEGVGDYLRLYGNLTHPKLSSELNLQNNTYLLEDKGSLGYAQVVLKNSVQYFLSSFLGLSMFMDGLSKELTWVKLSAEPFYWGDTGVQSRLRLMVGHRFEVLLRVYWSILPLETARIRQIPMAASMRYYLSHEWFLDMGWIPQEVDSWSASNPSEQGTSWLLELVFSKRF